MESTETKYTAEILRALIRKRYKSDPDSTYNDYVVLEEVPDGTGSYQRRWIDAAVFSLWPSKGITRAAFEIKISRADFIHELQQPDKHKWVEESFHEFWFVAPQGVIQESELPVGAGWMYPRGDQLCIKRHAVRNKNPKLDDFLLAGFMRAAYKEIHSSVNRKTLLAESKEYQQAKIFQDAVREFLNKRLPDRYYQIEKEKIISKLEEATLDSENKKDREQIEYVLQRFQNNIKELFSYFAVLASHSLLAKNEAGDYLIEKWGSSHLNGELNNLKNDKTAKENAAILGEILNWRHLRKEL